MEKKYYITPEIAKNEVYTLSNLALEVGISNSEVNHEATKQRKDENDKHDNSTDWGNIW